MKKLFIVLTAFFLFSFSEQKLSFSQTDILTAQKNISGIYEYIDKSNLPHQDVIQLQKTLKETYDLLGKGKIDSTKSK